MRFITTVSFALGLVLGLATSGATAKYSHRCRDCKMWDGHIYENKGHLIRCDCDIDDPKATIKDNEWAMAHLNEKLGVGEHGMFTWGPGKYRGKCDNLKLEHGHFYHADCRSLSDNDLHHTCIDLDEVINWQGDKGWLILRETPERDEGHWDGPTCVEMLAKAALAGANNSTDANGTVVNSTVV